MCILQKGVVDVHVFVISTIQLPPALTAPMPLGQALQPNPATWGTCSLQGTGAHLFNNGPAPVFPFSLRSNVLHFALPLGLSHGALFINEPLDFAVVLCATLIAFHGIHLRDRQRDMGLIRGCEGAQGRHAWEEVGQQSMVSGFFERGS